MGELLPRRALLIATTWWSGPAKLAVALARHGWELSAVCPPDHPFAYISNFPQTYPYKAFNLFGSLLEAVTKSYPSVLIPCDDGAVRQLHELYERRPELRPLIQQSLGDAAGYATLASRARVADLVRSLEIRAPQTVAVKDRNDLKPWFEGAHRSGVLKSDGSFGGKGVRIVHSLAEATKALKHLSRPINIVGASMRWLALRDPLSFEGLGATAPVVLQELILGQPANILFLCEAGKVLASVIVEVLASEGVTGAALAVRVIQNEEIRQAAEKIAESLKLSGFHGLDFILEAGTGDAFLIEMNPRCTQLGHLVLEGQGDLAGFLDGSSVSPAAEVGEGISRQVVVFYPQGLWSLRHPLPGEDVYVDLPWQEVRLSRELMKRDWRERHWIGRLYYKLRPNKRPAVTWRSESRDGRRDEQPGEAANSMRPDLAADR